MEQKTESLGQGRAGAYRKQPAGYRAFIPAPLPPDPPIQLEGGLHARLSTANLALGRLDGSIQTLPNPDLSDRHQLCGRHQLVERLVTIGVLREMTGQSRNRRFRYDAYIRLFDKPGVDSEGAGA